MSRPTLALFALVIGLAAGYAASVLYGPAERAADTPGSAAPAAREILYWVAPMDPNYRQSEPGKSPMGMDLVPVYADGAAPDTGPGVRIDPAVVNNLGVETAAVERRVLRERIHTVGRLEFNEERLAHVHLRASGWIHRLAIRAAGERVSQGALLFDVYSPDLVKAQAEYLQTLRSGREALIAATRDRLRALGITEAQIEAVGKNGAVNQYVHVYAPRGGVVTTLNVADGKYVGPESDIMVIADLNELWLISDVFESQAGLLEIGLPVRAQTTFADAGAIATTVEYVYPDLDPVTRTLRVRSVVDNTDARFKPGMFMTVSIEGRTRAPALVVPGTALIRTGLEERVVLAEGGGRFRPVAVESGLEADGFVEIRAGLADGDEVVVSGQFLIDSESSFAGASTRLAPASSSVPQGGSPPHAGHDAGMPHAGHAP